jgi:hypothetical protein
MKNRREKVEMILIGDVLQGLFAAEVEDKYA